jgi:hypothetical protein
MCTQASKDGGKDIIAEMETEIGKILCLVEAKPLQSGSSGPSKFSAPTARDVRRLWRDIGDASDELTLHKRLERISD